MSSFQRWVLVVPCVVLLMLHKVAAAAEPLVMGIFPRVDAMESSRMFQPLAQYLSEAIGQPVVLEIPKDFEAFSRALADKRFDIVHLNQYQYLKANKEQGYLVIAKNIEQGSDTLAAAIVVRGDSKAKSLADLKGNKIIFGGDRTAMQAYVGTTYLLRRAGLKRGDYVEVFAKTPPNAVLATFYKQADAAGAGDRVLKIPSVAKQIDVRQMRFLAVGDSLPHLPWAVKGTMTRDLRTKIQLAMLGLNKSDEGRALLKRAGFDGFSIASNSDYDRHRIIIREVLGEKY